MVSSSVKGTAQAVQTSLAVLAEMLGDYQPRDFAIRLWDGTEWPAATGQPRFTIVLQHPGALRQMFLPPSEMHLAEAYIYDDFDIEGDIEAIYPVADFLMAKPWNKMEQLRFGSRLLSLPKSERDQKSAAHLHGARHSRTRDRQAISYHYDRSNDFYALWLDQRMVYSCAYFQHPDDTLDAAQEQKLDYICRKLRLQPGERLLDIGCGWGGLVMYAAQHYGVTALGITLSQAQVDLARARIAAAGLADRCQVELRDYRELQGEGAFDKLVSVGMFEHVGAALLPTYFAQAWRLLKPGGVFLNHGIASSADNPPQQGENFTFKYVFPDGELVPLNTTLHAAEASHFEVRDVESLREHYALTLHHWVRNLEAHAAEARRLTDETTYRIWRLYMSASIHGFRTRGNNLYQTLLVKSEHAPSGLPLTRADWYTKTAPSEARKITEKTDNY